MSIINKVGVLTYIEKYSLTFLSSPKKLNVYFIAAKPKNDHVAVYSRNKVCLNNTVCFNKYFDQLDKIKADCIPIRF